MFSDKSRFYVNSPRQAFCMRPKNVTRYESEYCQKTIKYPQKVMVWGYFSGFKGHGTLAFLPKGVNMNKWTYIKVF